MAKRAKADDGHQEGISPDELRRVIEEASRQKALASEYAGMHGSVIKNAVERFGLEKNALTFARRLKDMEEGKRQAVIRAFIDYSAKLGFFDQIDAFDDLVSTLEAIVAKARADQKPAAKRGPTAVDAVLN